MFHPSKFVKFLVSFLFCNHLPEEERPGCFTLIVFLLSYDCLSSVSFPHGAVGWSIVSNCGISCRHIHLFFFFVFFLALFLLRDVFIFDYHLAEEEQVDCFTLILFMLPFSVYSFQCPGLLITYCYKCTSLDRAIASWYVVANLVHLL